MPLVKKIIFGLLTLSFAGCLVVNKNDIVKQWTIDNYKVELHSGRNGAGLVYYYTLDKNSFDKPFFKSRKTDVSIDNLGDCMVSFNKPGETKYTFDVCVNRPDSRKTFLDSTIINSIEVVRIDSASIKSVYLNDKQKRFFINSWNRNTDHTPGSPRIKYLITVQQGFIRTFNSDGSFLYEQSNDAKYEFPDKKFFSSLFDK